MLKDERLKILSENIGVFTSRTDIPFEQRKLTLSHIASILCESYSNLSLKELDSIYKEITPDASGEEKILLYKEMSLHRNLNARMKEEFSIGSAETPAGAHGKIAFVKNDLNNTAFDFLSRSINNAKPIWVLSFASACESVVDGKSEFCLLPIENSSDGKLLGFYSMIERYDLKICTVCEVDDRQGETVSYALLARGCKELSKKSDGCELAFEFSLLSESCDFLTELLCASSACQASMEKVCFLPVQYDTRLKRYIFSFKVPSQELLPFNAFLALSYHSYTPIGYYIKNNI